jgi:hypothetical protein
VIPGEGTQLARTQAERDGQDEERLEPPACVGVFVQAEMGTASPAGRVIELGTQLDDSGILARLVAARDVVGLRSRVSSGRLGRP